MINRRELLAAASLAPAMAGAMTPSRVPLATTAELLALIGMFSKAEKLYSVLANPDGIDLATNEVHDAWQAECSLVLERLDTIGEILHERIKSIVGALPAAVVLPDGRICLALKAEGPDGSSHVRPILLERSQIARLG